MLTRMVTEVAPDFTLTDLQGRQIRLSHYQPGRHVVLVFNRVVTWPFCRRHLAQLRQDYQAFRQRRAEVLVVSPEDRLTLAGYWQKEDLPFVGLPDPDHTVAGQYGQEVNLLKLGRLPALLVIDRWRGVRYKHYGHSMRDIPSNQAILALLDELNQED